MAIKTLGIAALYFFLLLIPESGAAQEINGIVKSKTSTIQFEGFGFENTRFDGQIHSNLSGSKYTVALKNGENEFAGTITDKLLKFTVNLSYKGEKSEGYIKRKANGMNDEWNIDFLGNKLKGEVSRNAINTTETYNLSYGNSTITGTIHEKVNNTLVYDLLLNRKKVAGNMLLNITSVKHMYSLSSKNLTEDELVVLMFIETIKLINERIDDVDDFQKNN